MVIIVNYGLGNLKSIQNILKKIEVKSSISSQIGEIESADKLILPGVGAFDNAMKNIKSLGLVEVLNWKVQEKKTPVLGICLGMQMMTKESEEGIEIGFGWINADTIKFKHIVNNNDLRIPHMGWNNIILHRNDELFSSIEPNKTRFYFVHSYYVRCFDKQDITSTTHYGIDFVSSFRKDNIIGTQFHPEKSHRFGMEFLKSFVKIV